MTDDLAALVRQLQDRLVGEDLLRQRIAELESASRVRELEKLTGQQRARIVELEARLAALAPQPPKLEVVK